MKKDANEDSFPSQDRSRNLHMFYTDCSSSKNDEEKKKKKKVEILPVEIDDCE